MMIITSLTNSSDIAKKLAQRLRIKYVDTIVNSFPDKDIYLRFNFNVKGKKLVIVQSFQPNPNKSLYEVVFAAKTAKDLGAKEVILIAPYLAFMRQDIRFNPGEAISSRVMAWMLNGCLDKVITIDTHLHRYKSMKDIFTISARNLTANLLIADYIEKKIKNTVIIGPDWESYQWAENIAKHINVEATVLEKTRYNSRKVSSRMIKPIPIKGKNVVIVDDIISTGHTIAEAAKKARKMGAKSVTAIGVHGLFVEGGLDKLRKAGVSKVVSTNCIKHKTNAIDVTPLLYEELRKMKR